MTNLFLTDFENPKSLVEPTDLILVVDDSEDYQDLVKATYAMSKKTNEIVFLSSGEELLSYLHGVLEKKEKFPGLILLDINMPGLTGFDVLKELKSHPEFQVIPIVIISTNSSSPYDQKEAKNLGANGFWTKPSGIEKYVDFFNNL